MAALNDEIGLRAIEVADRIAIPGLEPDPAQRYRKLGGSITLIAKPGVGHHPHGLDDPTPIVEFIVKHAAAGREANR